MQSEVNDSVDIGQRERRLGGVCGHHHLDDAGRRWGEGLQLVLEGQLGVDRDEAVVRDALDTCRGGEGLSSWTGALSGCVEAGNRVVRR